MYYITISKWFAILFSQFYDRHTSATLHSQKEDYPEWALINSWFTSQPAQKDNYSASPPLGWKLLPIPGIVHPSKVHSSILANLSLYRSNRALYPGMWEHTLTHVTELVPERTIPTVPLKLKEETVELSPCLCNTTEVCDSHDWLSRIGNPFGRVKD